MQSQFDRDQFRNACNIIQRTYHSTRGTPGDRTLLDQICLHMPGCRGDQGLDTITLTFQNVELAECASHLVPGGCYSCVVWTPHKSMRLPAIDPVFASDPLVNPTQYFSANDFRRALSAPGILDGWVPNGDVGYPGRAKQRTLGRTFDDARAEPLLRAALILIGIRPLGDPRGYIVEGRPEPRTLTLTETQLESFRRGHQK